MSIEPGVLYVVATPIGNLGDISERALSTLREADVVAAEDTRHSKSLLAHFGIQRRLLSLHEHNEEARLSSLLAELAAGASVALISDAGTPLISDPGYRLVREARRAGVRVLAVPGPSSLTAALSVAGLPTDRFCFEGFLPAKGEARRRRLQALATESRTLVFLESSHRIESMVADLAGVLGADRELAVCRELTKQYETVLWGGAAEIAERIAGGSPAAQGRVCGCGGWRRPSRGRRFGGAVGRACIGFAAQGVAGQARGRAGGGIDGPAAQSPLQACAGSGARLSML